MKDQLLIKEQLINDLGIPLDEYHQSQNINEFTWTSGYGKQVSEITPNTYIGRRINDLPVNHFGSVRDYDIDTLPLSYVKCKGTEITWVSTKAKEFKGKYMISRRFLSKLLQKWCYIVDIKYRNKVGNYNNTGNKTGISIWCKTSFVKDLIHGELREVHLLTGEDAIYMLRDILFLMRNQSPDKIFEKISYSKVSSQLWEVLMEVALSDKKKFKKQLNKIKERLYYDFQARNIVWNFPKWNSKILGGYMKELYSDNYVLDMGIPVIYDLWNYPIKCTDLNELQQVDDVMDDYDLQGYIWERG